jgi:RNA 2',3'-cyclic 3'-phosphodiesterase
VRLFLAVDLSDEVRARASASIDRLRESMARHQAPRVGWVTAERLHITLEFIGDVPDAVASDVVRCLEPPIPLAPFEVVFGGLGVFPPGGRPRVVWIGVDRGAQELQCLRDEAVRRLDGVDYRREPRSLSPHLTLGRFREPGRPSDREVLASTRLPEIGACTVDRLTTYRSRLSPKGPTYTAVLETLLATDARP